MSTIINIKIFIFLEINIYTFMQKAYWVMNKQSNSYKLLRFNGGNPGAPCEPGW
jgi:hypothetical protein